MGGGRLTKAFKNEICRDLRVLYINTGVIKKMKSTFV